jgi:hypothetical protein
MDIDRRSGPSGASPCSIAGEPHPARRPELMGRSEGGNSVVTGTGGQSAAIIGGADITGITDDSGSGETS